MIALWRAISTVGATVNQESLRLGTEDTRHDFALFFNIMISKRDLVIITNNPLVYEKLKDKYEIQFFDGSYLDVLLKVRDLVYKNHKLLTHPLSGSIKPKETKYKSIAIEKKETALDNESCALISNAIEVYKKFNVLEFPDSMLFDFQLVDLSLIASGLGIEVI